MDNQIPDCKLHSKMQFYRLQTFRMQLLEFERPKWVLKLGTPLDFNPDHPLEKMHLHEQMKWIFDS